ncbi:FKBP-type peptidyl-prolyl cis-trans isomerase [Pseudomaricurvus alkylphenolicus]|uniref:FKBP-type peptidyl-prolyl cis-trans isomerase n=1 Tax=Pseudomaricurvus alkylphenolicus TaxID=1306991 RepID=UPI001421AFF0|nr:FKBP-type peptidyl-prolyl cis-trans isomerase [Pseudomaricurvus alkylphenolicus]NIB42056.1 FKBP-type peptidyl-prolyl cis-trans isomerase [Pseudomaricurvus alkylphenolicus]
MTKIIVAIIAIVAVFLLVQRVSAGKSNYAENLQKGREFLEQNKSKEGVVSTASGLQYLVLEAGDGKQRPGARDKVKVHYHGTLIDGTVFDSSVDRGEPIEFGLYQVIKGWQEGLQLMSVGEKTRLFIPSDLGYGKRSAGIIPPGSVLIFDVELLDIR